MPMNYMSHVTPEQWCVFVEETGGSEEGTVRKSHTWIDPFELKLQEEGGGSMHSSIQQAPAAPRGWELHLPILLLLPLAQLFQARLFQVQC